MSHIEVFEKLCREFELPFQRNHDGSITINKQEQAEKRRCDDEQ